jgi:hypothetical protein
LSPLEILKDKIILEDIRSHRKRWVTRLKDEIILVENRSHGKQWVTRVYEGDPRQWVTLLI